ncbi:MAG: PaaI family thioesterase [Planctomycetes bacterium]|nr:PaaI family thioesterase [Planctomycetota bacterium]
MTKTPRDPHFEARVRDSFARQRAMATLGITMGRVVPGEVDLEVPYREDLTQQHGFLHAGVIATMADSACGYAAFSLMAADVGVLSVEFKINLLAPARGQRFVARARVLRAGRTLSVCAADVVAVDGTQETAIAALQATIMAIAGRADVQH